MPAGADASTDDGKACHAKDAGILLSRVLVGPNGRCRRKNSFDFETLPLICYGLTAILRMKIVRIIKHFLNMRDC